MVGTMMEKRFLTLADVGEVLNISSSQTYALVRSGELPAIQVGGRGQWRVESAKLEEYIAGAYRKAAAARSALPVGTALPVDSALPLDSAQPLDEAADA